MRKLLYETVIGPYENATFMLFEYTPNPDSTKPGSVRWGILEGPTFTGAEEDLITGPYLDGVKVLPGRIIQIRVFEVKRLATRGIEMESRTILPMEFPIGEDTEESVETTTRLMQTVTEERGAAFSPFGCSTPECDVFPCPPDKPVPVCGESRCDDFEPPGGRPPGKGDGGC